MIFLCLLIKSHNVKTIFEFGTFTGKTTYNLALNLPKDGHIYTIDIGRDIDRSNVDGKGYESSYVVGKFFLSSPDEVKRKITQLTSNSRKTNYGQFECKMDLVFIDGGHQYDVVRSDSANAFKMLKRRGIIVWHDYDPYWPGVMKR